MFWSTCPKCKKKFGNPPKYVQMFLERLIAHYKNNFKGVKTMLEQAEKDLHGTRKEA